MSFLLIREWIKYKPTFARHLFLHETLCQNFTCVFDSVYSPYCARNLRQISLGPTFSLVRNFITTAQGYYPIVLIRWLQLTEVGLYLIYPRIVDRGFTCLVLLTHLLEFGCAYSCSCFENLWLGKTLLSRPRRKWEGFDQMWTVFMKAEYICVLYQLMLFPVVEYTLIFQWKVCTS